ncbi:MAG TPA: hypothetical protein DEA91_15130, partial [Paenibacillus sp.]|nr:hypothetical protein [Paenibacillus sp.]
PQKRAKYKRKVGTHMDIHSDSYKVAALSEQEEALEIIRNAEASIAHLTGNPTVTLIAYEKSEVSGSQH